MEVCRICNVEKVKDDLKVTLDYLASEKLTYKSFFEKFTGTNYSNDTSLPQKICKSCQAEINLFIIKAEAWTHNERALRRPKRKISEIPIKDDKQTKEVHKQPKMMKPQNSFDDVRKLFELNDKDPLKDFEKFSRIMVDHSNLEQDGEISQKWLQKNVMTKKVWSEMVFECFCDKKVTSLIDYLNHHKTHGNTMKLKCPENCNEVFNSLSPFINHIVSKHHFEYLCYCCIACGKIFYNIPALINHYESKHPNIQNLYMCVECGSYCQNLKYLSSHKDLHYPIVKDDKIELENGDKIVVVDKDSTFLLETDISFSGVNKRKRGRRPKNNKSLPGPSVAVKSFMNLNKTMRTYHPKTHDFDETSNRQTFPCPYESCSRILITKTGYDYHMMVHDGTKPFKCDHCGKAFRSRQLKNSHMRSFHEND
ncbi:gastrula zinc finger protein XlCGF26.1-like [Chironomus tepperi]|uniref:gastrula zinc finger protein XlCGF26.1-like n=1 Tax=Chironomus tepperi TaxID=113505 RepID=UPI00391F741C